MKKLRMALGLCACVTLLSGCGKSGAALESNAFFADALQSADEARQTREMEKQEYGSRTAYAYQTRGREAKELRPAEEQVTQTKLVKSLDDLARELTERQQAYAETMGITVLDGADGAESEPRELTEQEVKKLQYSVRATDNGFFACTYYRPEEIDWQTVLQGGAGMRVTLSDDQIAQIREGMRASRVLEAREKALMRGEIDDVPEDGGYDPEEPFTEEELALSSSNVTALTLRSIQNFVKSRTGLEYSEARKPLEWPIIAKNLFYYVPGEINTVRVEFMKASVCGNVYEIYWRKAVWSKEKKPEYVMRAEVEKGKWKFISNLPIDEVQPQTLASIDFYLSRTDALVNWPREWIEIPELPKEEEFEEEPASSKKKTKDEPVPYVAVITAEQDNCVISVDRVYTGDEICMELAKKHSYVPGENLATVTLQKGEKIGINVTLEDVPKLRIKVTSGAYYGDYAFGSENWLKRKTKEGVPLPTYVMGRDLAGERRGPEYHSEAELLRLLEGTWLFYDSTMGEYTAALEFTTKGNVTLKTVVETYKMEISGYDRLYVDTRSDPPDVIKLKSTDEETLELFTRYYPKLVRKVGDYRVRAVQKDGELMLMLSFENTGKDGLSALIPGADPLAEEIVLYRFTGTVAEEGEEEHKG